jgi:hypothetical protein
MWPGTMREYEHLMARFEPADFLLTRQPAIRPEARRVCDDMGMGRNRSGWTDGIGGADVDGCGAGAGIGFGTRPLDASLTRRRLLAAGGAAALAATLGELRGVAPVLSEVTIPAYLRRSSYLALVGERFELIAAGGRGVLARLVAVVDLGVGARVRPLGGAEEAFALLFHSSSRPRLEQDVVSLRHPALGRFQLLVSPASTGRRGQDYSAVINRARPRAL